MSPLSLFTTFLWKYINFPRWQPCSLSWRTWPWRRWRTRWSSSSSPRPTPTQSSKSAQMCKNSFIRFLEIKRWKKKLFVPIPSKKTYPTNSQQKNLFLPIFSKKKLIPTNFQHLESGLMEVISPPSEFYPDLAGLRKTLGMIGKNRKSNREVFCAIKNSLYPGTI